MKFSEYKQKILEEQENKPKTFSKYKQERESKPISAAVSGAVSSFFTTPTDIASLLEGSVDLSKNIIKAANNGDYSLKDAAIDTIQNNYSMELSDKIDRSIRNFFGSPQWEDMTPVEQAADLGGSLAAPSALLKLFKISGKSFRKIAQKVANKTATKTNKTLTPKQFNKIGDYAENVGNFVLPGVQITKNAPTSQKLVEGITQTAIPLAMNEGMRAIGDQEGILFDYGNDKQDLENIKLLKDNRSLRRKTPLTDADYLITQIDNAAIEEEQNKQALQTAGLIGGALLGSVAASRMLRSTINKDLTPTNITKDGNFIQNLDNKTQFDMAVADSFAFKNKAVEEGYLSLNTASELGQDFGGKVNNAYDTGKLGFGVETNIAPAELDNTLNGLKINNTETYQKIEDCLDLSNRLQSEAHKYNANVDEEFELLSTDDYIKKMLNNTKVIETDKNIAAIAGKKTKEAAQKRALSDEDYKRVKEIEENYKNYVKTLEDLQKDPMAKQILDNISDNGKKMLEVQVRSGVYTRKYADYLLKNRTVNGFFSYKHIKPEQNKTIIDRAIDYLLRKRNKEQKPNQYLQPRTSENKLPNQSYLQTFEESVKGVLQDVEKQVMIRKIVTDMKNNEVKKIKSLHTSTQKAQDAFYNALFNSRNLNVDTEFETYRASRKELYKELHNRMVVKPLGKAKLFMDEIGEIIPTKLSDLINEDYKYHQHYDRDTLALLKNIKNNKNLDNIITYDYQGYRYYEQVDPILAESLKFGTETMSIVGEALRDLKNFVQKTITGALNPAFAIPSSIMSSHEGLTLLNVIGKRLRLAPDDISRIEYLKEFKYAFDQIYTEGQLQNIMEKYNTILGLMTEGIDPKFGNYLKDVNIEATRNDLRNLLLTDIKSLGGASAKPYTTERGAFYNVRQLNMNITAFDNIKQKLNNIYGYHGAKQVLNLFNNLQNAIRETPSVALVTLFGKKTGAIINNKIADPQKLQEIIDVVGTLTANVGRSGSGAGLAGNLAKLTENFANYGNIMIKSLAPKIRASGISTGVENVMQTIKDLYDPRVPFIDILQNIQKHSKDFVNNDFVKGAFISGMLPALAAYVWNNGSTKNREYYYAHSDHDKVSKLMFMNILGEGRHLYMPMDQEVALVSNIFTTMLDGILGMSKYQENDPAFQQSKMIMKSLARSVGLDSVPVLDILANVSGYDINLNMFDENAGINPLPRDKINADLSETAYENGVFSQKTHALLRSLFGNVGAIVLGIAEEGNVASNNDNILSTTIASITDNMTKSARLLTNDKSLTSFNETSKTVYEKQNLLDKIASVRDKNPKQAEIYETVKMFNRNKIKPIHDEITATRQQINTMKATGRLPNGEILSYSDKKQAANDLNRKLQKLFAQEYKEFNRLDNLLTQMYGNNITLKNFMQKNNGE